MVVSAELAGCTPDFEYGLRLTGWWLVRRGGGATIGYWVRHALAGGLFGSVLARVLLVNPEYPWSSIFHCSHQS